MPEGIGFFDIHSDAYDYPVGASSSDEAANIISGWTLADGRAPAYSENIDPNRFAKFTMAELESY